MNTIDHLRRRLCELAATASLNPKSTGNRWLEEWDVQRLILADALEEAGSPEAALCRADWRREKMPRRYPGNKYEVWSAAIPDGVGVAEWLPKTRKVRRAPARWESSDFCADADGGTYVIRASPEYFEVTLPYTPLLNAGWLLHFAPLSLRLLSWSHRAGDHRRLLFTHAERRKKTAGFRLDVDVHPDGFAALFVAPEKAKVEMPLLEGG